MGKIVYKPHCGKCGAIIEQEVTYREIAQMLHGSRRIGRFIDIEPNKCPCCREVFGTIEIPMPKEENNGV